MRLNKTQQILKDSTILKKSYETQYILTDLKRLSKSYETQ